MLWNVFHLPADTRLFMIKNKTRGIPRKIRRLVFSSKRLMKKMSPSQELYQSDVHGAFLIALKYIVALNLDVIK